VFTQWAIDSLGDHPIVQDMKNGLKDIYQDSIRPNLDGMSACIALI